MVGPTWVDPMVSVTGEPWSQPRPAAVTAAPGEMASASSLRYEVDVEPLVSPGLARIVIFFL